MGDRISIAFSDRNPCESPDPVESVALFSDWDGLGLLRNAIGYIIELNVHIEENNDRHPLDRLEPGTVMTDFIVKELGKLQRITSNYYLGKDKTDGDNSNNGHFIIDLANNRIHNDHTVYAIEFALLGNDTRRGTDCRGELDCKSYPFSIIEEL